MPKIFLSAQIDEAPAMHVGAPLFYMINIHSAPRTGLMRVSAATC